MNNLFNAIKLDYFILKPYYLVVVIPVIVAILIGIFTSNPPLIAMALLIIEALFMNTLFFIYEKNNLNKLYGVLPIRRRQIVLGRYSFTLLFGIIAEFIAIIFTLVVIYTLNMQVNTFTIITFIYSFLIYLIIVSVHFPFYFKYDYSKINTIASLPFTIIFIAVVVTMIRNPKLYNYIIQYSIHNQHIVWLTVICICLILFGSSCFLSCLFYNKREL
jgi:hypothetical protein